MKITKILLMTSIAAVQLSCSEDNLDPKDIATSDEKNAEAVEKRVKLFNEGKVANTIEGYNFTVKIDKKVGDGHGSYDETLKIFKTTQIPLLEKDDKGNWVTKKEDAPFSKPSGGSCTFSTPFFDIGTEDANVHGELGLTLSFNGGVENISDAGIQTVDVEKVDDGDSVTGHIVVDPRVVDPNGNLSKAEELAETLKSTNLFSLHMVDHFGISYATWYVDASNPLLGVTTVEDPTVRDTDPNRKSDEQLHYYFMNVNTSGSTFFAMPNIAIPGKRDVRLRMCNFSTQMDMTLTHLAIASSKNEVADFKDASISADITDGNTTVYDSE